MKAKSTKSPYKDETTKELEKQVALEFAHYMEEHRDMTFDELLDGFYSNIIDNYNNSTEKVVGFSIKEMTDSAYEIEVWYW